MTTQLVLQFEADRGLDSFNKLVSFEEVLSSLLGGMAEVDGHDFGAGEMNIFILTDQPIASFNLVQQTDRSLRPDGEMKAAYRQLDKEDYICLWPPGLSNFQIT